MKDGWVPVESNVSLADASLLSFNFDEQKQFLSVKLLLWNEEKLIIVFENVLYFLYQPGDFVQGIFQNTSESPILASALIREFDVIPTDHFYRLISIKDIDDFSVAEVVCLNMVFQPE